MSELLVPESQLRVEFDGNDRKILVGRKDFPLSSYILESCNNISISEEYANIFLSKSFPLFESYIRRGSLLIGHGSTIGYMAFFSGKPNREMFCRSKERCVGIILNCNKIYNTMCSLGLLDAKLKELRFKGLSASKYDLVIRVSSSKRPLSDYSGNRVESIGLLGDDDYYVDLTSNWSNKLVLDLK